MFEVSKINEGRRKEEEGRRFYVIIASGGC
jgi:hypothetical protein